MVFVIASQFRIFCAVEKKLKHRRVGNECLPVRQTGRLTCSPFVISFLCLCSPVKMVYFFSVFSRLFVVVVSSFTLAGNRPSICEGREFIDCPARHKCPFENMLLKLRTKAEH